MADLSFSEKIDLTAKHLFELKDPYGRVTGSRRMTYAEAVELNNQRRIHNMFARWARKD